MCIVVGVVVILVKDITNWSRGILMHTHRVLISDLNSRLLFNCNMRILHKYLINKFINTKSFVEIRWKYEYFIMYTCPCNIWMWIMKASNLSKICSRFMWQHYIYQTQTTPCMATLYAGISMDTAGRSVSAVSVLGLVDDFLNRAIIHMTIPYPI